MNILKVWLTHPRYRGVGGQIVARRRLLSNYFLFFKRALYLKKAYAMAKASIEALFDALKNIE